MVLVRNPAFVQQPFNLHKPISRYKMLAFYLSFSCVVLFLVSLNLPTHIILHTVLIKYIFLHIRVLIEIHLIQISASRDHRR